MADFRPERVDFRPDRVDFRPDRADFWHDRPDFRPERAWGRRTDRWTDGRMDERTDGWMDVWKFTRVLQDIGPLGLLPKKDERKKTGRPRARCGQRYPLPCSAWL